MHSRRRTFPFEDYICSSISRAATRAESWELRPRIGAVITPAKSSNRFGLWRPRTSRLRPSSGPLHLKESKMAESKIDVLYGRLALIVLKTLATMGPQHGWGI